MSGELPAEHREMAAEQAWLDQAHRHLENMQRRATSTRKIGERAASLEKSVDAQVARFHLKRREEALHSGRGPLFSDGSIPKTIVGTSGAAT